MTKRMFIVLIIAIAIAMIIGPSSAAKPTPTDPHDAIWTAINSLTSQITQLRTDIALIPKGDNGAQGPVGPMGPQGPKGDTGAPGTCSCAISQEEFDALEARIAGLESQDCGDTQCTGSETYVTCPEDCDATCNPPFEECGVDCINPMTNKKHCGSCNNACAVTEMCKGGECVIEDLCGDDYCDPQTEDPINCPVDCASDCTLTNNGDEKCDTIDNDCDGYVDNGFDVGLSCGSEVGLCQFGVYVCNSEGSGTVCIGAVGPLNEVCDAQDNDCDGETDEGFNLGTPCSDGIGACYRTGSYVCTSNQLGSECNAVAGDPVDEVCGDGIDNDCDGDTDEDFNLGAPCSDGIGACYRTGSYVCTSNQLGSECDAVAGDPVDEVCGDGLDNDCDGQIDEGCTV